MKVTKQYAAKGLAGCVEQRKSPQTGHIVSVYNGEQAGLDTDDGRAPWSTVCEEHGFIVCHRSLPLARAHAADPLGWCEHCAAEKNGTGCYICHRPGTDPCDSCRKLVCGEHARSVDGSFVCNSCEEAAR